MEMQRKGISPEEQWINKRYVADDNGDIVDYGFKERYIAEADAIHRKDVGDKGGQGESVSERVRNLVDCMRTK